MGIIEMILIYYPIVKTETLMENNDEDAVDIFSNHIESVKNINFTLNSLNSYLEFLEFLESP